MRRKRRAMAEINVVPYIDVMLVLLIIFMITAPLLNQGVKVELPKAKAAAIANKAKEPIIVSVDKAGQFFLNISKDPTSAMPSDVLLNQVSVELKQNKAENISRNVLVKADSSVNYGVVMQAMVILQRAGAPNVGLITDPVQAPDAASVKTNQPASGNAWKA